MSSTEPALAEEIKSKRKMKTMPKMVGPASEYAPPRNEEERKKILKYVTSRVPRSFPRISFKQTPISNEPPTPREIATATRNAILKGIRIKPAKPVQAPPFRVTSFTPPSTSTTTTPYVPPKQVKVTPPPTTTPYVPKQPPKVSVPKKPLRITSFAPPSTPTTSPPAPMVIPTTTTPYVPTKPPRVSVPKKPLRLPRFYPYTTTPYVPSQRPKITVPKVPLRLPKLIPSTITPYVPTQRPRIPVPVAPLRLRSFVPKEKEVIVEQTPEVKEKEVIIEQLPQEKEKVKEKTKAEYVEKRNEPTFLFYEEVPSPSVVKERFTEGVNKRFAKTKSKYAPVVIEETEIDKYTTTKDVNAKKLYTVNEFAWKNRGEESPNANIPLVPVPPLPNAGVYNYSPESEVVIAPVAKLTLKSTKPQPLIKTTQQVITYLQSLFEETNYWG